MSEIEIFTFISQQCTCSQLYIMCNELQLTEMPLKMTSENTYFTIAQFEVRSVSFIAMFY